jgi:hypothetical protein
LEAPSAVIIVHFKHKIGKNIAKHKLLLTARMFFMVAFEKQSFTGQTDQKVMVPCSQEA